MVKLKFEAGTIFTRDDEYQISDLEIGKEERSIYKICHSDKWKPEKRVYRKYPFTYKGPYIKGSFDITGYHNKSFYTELKNCIIYQYVEGVAKGYCLMTHKETKNEQT